MKHIIIEGGDRLGKNALVKRIATYFDFENVVIRHFGKPPNFTQGKDVLGWQLNCFNAEVQLANQINQLEISSYSYFENTVIWNRSHLGEYVYGSMFRNYDKKILLEKLTSIDNKLPLNTYLILLTASPQFFLQKEDGKSFSKSLEDKEKELSLFKEIFHKSLITKKVLINVESERSTSHAPLFKDKEDIFKESLNLIND